MHRHFWPAATRLLLLLHCAGQAVACLAPGFSPGAPPSDVASCGASGANRPRTGPPASCCSTLQGNWALPFPSPHASSASGRWTRLARTLGKRGVAWRGWQGRAGSRGWAWHAQVRNLFTACTFMPAASAILCFALRSMRAGFAISSSWEASAGGVVGQATTGAAAALRTVKASAMVTSFIFCSISCCSCFVRRYFCQPSMPEILAVS